MVRQMLTNQPKKIGHMEFGLLSPKEIRGLSCTKVITADTYDDDGFPIEMGLMDPRLGVIEPGLRCKTCGQKVGDCPGHFGHIDLAMPIIHIGYVRVLRDVLRSTCRGCGKLLFRARIREDFDESLKTFIQTEQDTQLLASRVVKEAYKVTMCPHCGREHGSIDVDKPSTFRENGEKMTQSEVREWLEKVPNEDLHLLGLNPAVCRPEWMVLTVLPVPPVTMRPSITLESGERSEDDLTHKLVDVIRINQRLQENRDAGAPQLIVEDLWELLQYHITTYFDNQTAGIPHARHRSGRELKTLAQRLKGKEGRFRSNLSGKRVNFSARTVISPDPNLSINEVGVPAECAQELTVPIRVTPANFQYCMDMILRGPEPKPGPEGKYIPGTNYVIRPDGRRVKVTDKNADEVAKRLEVGSIVERQLDDGDVVLFNRQPTLHRMSMMAHTVRVMPGKTFRFNLLCCPPYNADFDGDEMNLHVLQGEEARAEAEILMRPEDNIRSPRFGGPIIGAIQDHLAGCFLLTWKNPKIALDVAASLVARIAFKGSLPAIHEEKDARGEIRRFVYGRDVFSLILPPGINLSFKAQACPQRMPPEELTEPHHDYWVQIEDSKLVAGGIDKAAIGSEAGQLLDHISRRFGPREARRFVESAARLSLAYLAQRGFSVSIDNFDLPAEISAKVHQEVERAIARTSTLAALYEQGGTVSLPSRSSGETLELEIVRELSHSRRALGEFASNDSLTNEAVLMARCGARGTPASHSQLVGFLGQQLIRGLRIHQGYRNRVLPHFSPSHLGAEAHGFVTGSFKSGLSPTQYFFHAMTGRSALVNRAVLTSRAGYMQRRLINALEDLTVAEDGTVRNTAGTIIQFVYGEDGADPSRSVRGQAVDFESIFTSVLGQEMDWSDVESDSDSAADEPQAPALAISAPLRVRPAQAEAPRLDPVLSERRTAIGKEDHVWPAQRGAYCIVDARLLADSNDPSMRELLAGAGKKYPTLVALDESFSKITALQGDKFTGRPAGLNLCSSPWTLEQGEEIKRRGFELARTAALEGNNANLGKVSHAETLRMLLLATAVDGVLAILTHDRTAIAEASQMKFLDRPIHCLEPETFLKAFGEDPQLATIIPPGGRSAANCLRVENFDGMPRIEEGDFLRGGFLVGTFYVPCGGTDNDGLCQISVELGKRCPKHRAPGAARTASGGIATMPALQPRERSPAGRVVSPAAEPAAMSLPSDVVLPEAPIAESSKPISKPSRQSELELKSKVGELEERAQNELAALHRQRQELERRLEAASATTNQALRDLQQRNQELEMKRNELALKHADLDRAESGLNQIRQQVEARQAAAAERQAQLEAAQQQAELNRAESEASANQAPIGNVAKVEENPPSSPKPEPRASDAPSSDSSKKDVRAPFSKRLRRWFGGG